MANAAPSDQEVLTKLRSTFGFQTLRPLQQNIIRSVLNGQDVFVLMPTGGGKSLCFQLPALLQPGVTVVVSPLIALMKDQVDRLEALRIPAAFINSSLDPSEARRRLASVMRGQVKLLYVAPERLASPGFLDTLAAVDIASFAIDEAHCISEWGHDFRPEYRELSRLRELFPRKPIAAFTATATERVQGDILAQLRLRNPAVFRGSLNRPNLYYQIWPKRNGYDRIFDYLRTRRHQSGIIYVQSREGTEKLAARLRNDGFQAVAYHAGLDPNERRERQEAFLSGIARIMVATIAFGMGIDKPNVRFVIHYDLPKNLEGYYQESGRAGRDGEPSDCILLYTYGDAVKREHFIRQKPTEGERRDAWEELDRMVHWAQGTACRREALLAYFDQAVEGKPRPCCDVCDPPNGEEADYTVAAQKLLSCAKRTGEAFGAAHLIGVLRGSRAQRLLSYGHGELPTYGIGREYTDEEWAVLAHELIKRGYARKQPERYDALAVTPLGAEVLFKGRKVTLPTLAGGCRSSAAPGEKAQPAARPKPRAPGDSVRETVVLFRAGKRLPEIAAERGLAVSTIEGHIAEAMEAGEAIDVDLILGAERRAAIEAVLRRLGPGPLKPVRDALGESYSYNEIRLVRAAIGYHLAE